MALGDTAAARGPSAGLALAAVALACLAFEVASSDGDSGGLAAGLARAPARPAASGSRGTIVVAQFREDLRWALPFARAGWRVVAQSKDAAAAGAFLAAAAAANLSDAVEARIDDAENWGDEAVAYLRFLSSLTDDGGASTPPLAVFLHGEPFAHSPYLDSMLACANADFVGYFGLSGLFIEANAVGPPQPERAYWRLFRERILAECRARGLAPLDMPPLLRVDFAANAQFLVSAAAVRRRPRAFWQALLHVALSVRNFSAASGGPGDVDHQPPRKVAAFFFELVWHELFGAPRLLPWPEAGDVCGERGSAAPLLRECCELPAHAALVDVLRSPRRSQTVQRSTWSWREKHKRAWRRRRRRRR